MKKFLFLYFLAPLAFFATSCGLPEITENEQEATAPQSVSGSTVLTATLADPLTKTTLAEGEVGLSVLWAYKDKLTVFYKGVQTLSTSGAGVTNGFTAVGQESEFPKETATFSGVFPAGNSSWDDPYLVYAIYPYRFSGNNLTRAKGVTTLKTQLNSIQDDARVASTSDSVLVHVGRTTDATVPMKFYNMCSLLRFKVSNTDVRRVDLSSDQVISGVFLVDFDDDGIPYVADKQGNDSKKSITLYKEDNSAFSPDEWYYIALLPTTFTNGATLTVYTSDGKLERNLKQGVSFERNHCKSVGVLDEGKTYERCLSAKLAYFSKTIANNSTVTLWPEGSASLTASLSNSSGIDVADSWTWESSEPTIATVVDGLVTPIFGATGETVITATTTYDNVDYTACCTISVSNEASALKAKPFTVDGVGTQVYFAPGNLYLAQTGETTTYGFNTYQGQILSFNTWDTMHRDKFKWWNEIAIITEESGLSYTPREFTIDNKTWKTPSNDQWTYLYNHTKYVKAVINGVSGLILLPNYYSHPRNVAEFEGVRKPDVPYSTNLYYGSDWTNLEQAGAVFLPAAGMYTTSFVDVGASAQYLSCTFKARATPITTSKMYCFTFSATNVTPSNNLVSYYFPVRLIRAAE